MSSNQQNCQPCRVRRIETAVYPSRGYWVVKPHHSPEIISDAEVVWQDKTRAIRNGRFYVLEAGQPLNGLWNHHGKTYEDVRKLCGFLENSPRDIILVDRATLSILEWDLQTYLDEMKEKKDIEILEKFQANTRLFKFPIFY